VSDVPIDQSGRTPDRAPDHAPDRTIPPWFSRAVALVAGWIVLLVALGRVMMTRVAARLQAQGG
jgi:hypothetical protein